MSINFTDRRVKMVDGQIRTAGVTDHKVLDAFLAIPREPFVPTNKRELAYTDSLINVGDDRFLLEPSALAKLVELAKVESDDVVLDIGCASGYGAAILSKLASSVIALESDEKLATNASQTLSDLGYDNVVVLNKDLLEGYSAEAPYDVILVESRVEFIPDAIFKQLRENGRLICIEGNNNVASAKVYSKIGSTISGNYAFNCSAHVLKQFTKNSTFSF